MRKIVYRCDICGKEVKNPWRAQLREYKVIEQNGKELMYRGENVAVNEESVIDICGECYNKIFKECRRDGYL